PIDHVRLSGPCFEFSRRLRLFQYSDCRDVPMRPMFMLPKADVHILLIIAPLVASAELASLRQTVAQTSAYTVSELSGAGVPNRLNNLGDVAGRAGDSLSGKTQATLWNHGSLRRRNLGNLAGGEYSS